MVTWKTVTRSPECPYDRGFNKKFQLPKLHRKICCKTSGWQEAFLPKLSQVKKYDTSRTVIRNRHLPQNHLNVLMTETQWKVSIAKVS